MAATVYPAVNPYISCLDAGCFLPSVVCCDCQSAVVCRYGANVTSPPSVPTQPRPGSEISTHFFSVGGQECQQPTGIPLTFTSPNPARNGPKGPKKEEEEAASRHGGSGRRSFPLRSGVIGSILAASKEESQRRLWKLKLSGEKLKMSRWNEMNVHMYMFGER